MNSLRSSSLLRLVPVALALVLVTACASTTTTTRTVTSRARAEPVGESPESRSDPRLHPVLDPLHPPGSLPLLARIEATPRDADVYAEAAAAYATTDACGMSVFWAQTYRLLEPDGARGLEMAQTIRRIYATRITVDANGSSRTIHTRLAPGSTPVLAMGDGRLLVPFAHRYETSIATGAPDPGSFDGVAVSIARYASVASMPIAIGTADTELAAYLRTFDDPMLAVYGHWIVGPAFEAEWSTYQTEHSAELEQLRAFVAAHPFTPTRGVRPDDLVDVRAR